MPLIDDPRTSIPSIEVELLARGPGMLLVSHGPDRGKSLALAAPSVSIGTSPDCDLRLTDRRVSRHHLTIVRDGMRLVVRDMGSRNGSYVQGARFEQIAIGFGTEIRVGRTLLLYVPFEESREPREREAEGFGSLVGRSPAMRRLYAQLADVAPLESTVLLEGETGTGKELVAEELHKQSPRHVGPFVVFDCGARHGDLMASALFGHVKGAFTGAVTDRVGSFAEARGGTIFLDEIGELPLELQTALLRVLDKKTVCPVGSNAYEEVDVRIIAATNRDLHEAVLSKSFREDLYYRLAVERIRLPALRERGDDIVALAEHFVREHTSGKLVAIAPADAARLASHDWPGNVRELRNLIGRACARARDGRLHLDGVLGPDEGTATEPPAPEQASNEVTVPPSSVIPASTSLPFKQAKGDLLHRFERDYLAQLMTRHGSNLSSAAREAQIDRKYLRELLGKHGLL